MTDSIAQISSAITARYGIGQADADKFVALMFDVLCKGIEDEGVVKVKGLGTFKLTEVSTRESVDVNTGERIVIDGHDKITFVPDVVLRDRVNSPFAQFETVVVNDGVDFSGIGELGNSEENQEMATNDEDMSAEDLVTDTDDDAAGTEDDAVKVSQDNNEQKEEQTPASAQQTAISLGDNVHQEEKATAAVQQTASVSPDASGSQETSLCESGECEQKAENMSTTEHISAMANKLTDASDKLSTASSKLSDVSDKLSDASDKLSGASDKLSDSSQKMSGTAMQSAGQSADTKQLADTIVVVNDLRNRLCEMKEQNFICTNENRKLKNANINLQRSLRNMRITLWALVGVLVAAVVASWAFGYAWCEMSYMPMEQYQDTAAETSVAVKSQQGQQKSSATKTQSAKSKQKAQIVEAKENDKATQKNAEARVDAQKAKQDNAVENNSQQPVAAPTQQTAPKASEPATANTKPNVSVNAKPAAVASGYDADPRVRTGAYRIVGVAQVVTVRKGQTLASVSRTYLGNGMECYVEALNGKEVKEGDKVKIPKLELKKKK